jgi:hypothetical protein
MRSLFTALSFIAMILAPCLVAMNTGIDQYDQEPEYPEDTQAPVRK